MAVNDNIRNALESYGGFSINERVYNYLGSLGYTGTINDRLAKYSYEDKKGWQALIAKYAGGLSEFLQLQQSLFGNGEQGLLFVPEPGFRGEDVLYQDAAGTTLADANGDPVGLGLEWSQGLVLGPELVTNGTFDADLSGWTPNSGAELTNPDGKLQVSLQSGDVFGSATTTISTTTGQWYKLTVDSVSASRPDGAWLRAYGAEVSDLIEADMGASNSVIFLADQATTTIELVSRFDGVTSVWDNVSVRELPGNHLTQPTSADRPLYRTDGTLHWLEHDQAGDNLVASLPDLGTNATLAYANAAGVTILEGQTISGDTIIPQEVELYGVIYLDRPFIASETTQVTNYLNKRRGA